VLKAIGREPIDRIPLDIWARPGIWRALQHHFCAQNDFEVRERMGVDVVWLSPCFEDHEFALKTDARIPGESDNSGMLVVDHGDRTYTNQWGVTYALDEEMSDDCIMEVPFPLPQIPDYYRWPCVEAIESVSSLSDRINACHRMGFCVFGSVLNPFKQAWQLRGFQDLLMDLYLYPEFVEKLLQRLLVYSVEMARRLARAGADVICIVGDVAGQENMFFDPEIFDKMLVPLFRTIIEEARMEASVPALFHSDGNIESVLSSLVEAGFNIVNPIQPECMEPYSVKERFGDVLTLHGLMSVQTVLPCASELQVRETVRELIDCCGLDGGLILSTTNVVTPDVPLSNLLAFYDETVRYSSTLFKNRFSST
jgi:uroporphyrinogen decarboxylase